MSRLRLRTVFVRLLLLGGWWFTMPASLSAHPWGGLVVDADGRVYFTFVCPFLSGDHYACVWALDDAAEPYEVIRAARSPSDLVLARTPSRTVFGAERDGLDVARRTRLWRLSHPDPAPVIPWTTDPEGFHVQAYAAADDGTILFARGARLFARDPTGQVGAVRIDGDVGRIDALAWGPEGQLFLIDDGALRILAPDGTLATRATGLKEDEPEDLPFAGANILFDLAVADDGTAYVAYYGNRRVLRVSPAGAVSTFLRAAAPWSPHGVDVYDGEVYVLESTVGGGSWWKVWERPVIVPRVRMVARDGAVSTLFERRPDR